MSGDSLSQDLWPLREQWTSHSGSQRDGFVGGHLVVSDLDVAHTACG